MIPQLPEPNLSEVKRCVSYLDVAFTNVITSKSYRKQFASNIFFSLILSFPMNLNYSVFTINVYNIVSLKK